jgi:uncharacterized RDD family membrane protein YckC
MERYSLTYATLRDRFLALLIDLAIFCVFFFPITKLVKGVWLMASSDHFWQFGWIIWDPLCLIFLLVIFAYYVVLEGLFGRTIGKLAMGIKVVLKNGEAPGLQKALLRNLLRLVDGLPAFNILGVILILVTKERTRVGDIVAGTRVVMTVK